MLKFGTMLNLTWWNGHKTPTPAVCYPWTLKILATQCQHYISVTGESVSQLLITALICMEYNQSHPILLWFLHWPSCCSYCIFLVSLQFFNAHYYTMKNYHFSFGTFDCPQNWSHFTGTWIGHFMGTWIGFFFHSA